jgi:RNA polymerase sigma-70 factor (ECF subfamily)
MKKDHPDLKRVIQEHYATLYAVAFNLVKSTGAAEDIVQEAIIKYWERREKQEIHSAGSYLYTLVKRASLNHLRGESRALERHERYMTGHADAEEPRVLRQLIEEESNRILREAIRSLPEMQARVVRAGYSGLTDHEIAKLFQISITTLKSLRYDAIRRLREYFDAHL